MARALDAAEGELDAAARPVIVDEDLARADGAGEAQLPPAIARPDPGDEAIGRAVGDADCLGFVIEGDDDLDRAEDLLLREAMIGRHAVDEGGADIVPALRCIGDDTAFASDGEIILASDVEIALDDLPLTAGDDGPDIEVGQGRADL